MLSVQMFLFRKRCACALIGDSRPQTRNPRTTWLRTAPKRQYLWPQDSTSRQSLRKSMFYIRFSRTDTPRRYASQCDLAWWRFGWYIYSILYQNASSSPLQALLTTMIYWRSFEKHPPGLGLEGWSRDGKASYDSPDRTTRLWTSYVEIFGQNSPWWAFVSGSCKLLLAGRVSSLAHQPQGTIIALENHRLDVLLRWKTWRVHLLSGLS